MRPPSVICTVKYHEQQAGGGEEEEQCGDYDRYPSLRVELRDLYHQPHEKVVPLDSVLDDFPLRLTIFDELPYFRDGR
jgi:hypothetical protein